MRRGKLTEGARRREGLIGGKSFELINGTYGRASLIVEISSTLSRIQYN